MSTYTHTVALRRRTEIAHQTLAFHFQKPEGFSFRPGQFVDVNVEADDTGNLPRTQLHSLTIASAPCQDELIVATRMRDTGYKRALQRLMPGATVTIEGPAGMLTLSPKHQRPAILIAGGIGITPFTSMAMQAAHERSPRMLTVLYVNRRPEDAAYLPELQALEARNPKFHLIATMTRMQDSAQPWNGAVGRIDSQKIEVARKGMVDPVFYLAGPPDMVGATYELLERMGIADSDIREEGFYGY